MFPFPIATPQGCNIQTFYGDGIVATGQKSWNKPVGVSHVYMLLIGAGGDGDGAGTPGGSGAVTVWYGAAQHVPDSLVIFAGTRGNSTRVTTRLGPGSFIILQAAAASTITGGVAFVANQFTASGFFQSVAGVNGVAGIVTPSATTFLSSGVANGTVITANYGYGLTTTANQPGFFMLQPIIVGCGSSGAQTGSIGCGGGDSSNGGPGMVLIASW
jgi:hypothetical protein